MQVRQAEPESKTQAGQVEPESDVDVAIRYLKEKTGIEVELEQEPANIKKKQGMGFTASVVTQDGKRTGSFGETEETAVYRLFCRLVTPENEGRPSVPKGDKRNDLMHTHIAIAILFDSDGVMDATMEFFAEEDDEDEDVDEEDDEYEDEYEEDEYDDEDEEDDLEG